jgi:hypothetical protein
MRCYCSPSIGGWGYVLYVMRHIHDFCAVDSCRIYGQECPGRTLWVHLQRDHGLGRRRQGPPQQGVRHQGQAAVPEPHRSECEINITTVVTLTPVPNSWAQTTLHVKLIKSDRGSCAAVPVKKNVIKKLIICSSQEECHLKS